MTESRASVSRPVYGVEFTGVFGATLIGITLCGIVLHLWSTEFLRYFALLVGEIEVTTGWLVLIVAGFLLTALFASLVGQYAGPLEERVRSTAEEHEAVGNALEPFLEWSSLGTAFGVAGLGYGLAIGAVLVGLLLPLWIEYGIGVAASFLFYHPVVLLAWAGYGVAIGLTYGSMLEKTVEANDAESTASSLE